MTGYSAAQRRQIRDALVRRIPPVCPVCGAVLNLSEVGPRPAVAYVRRRVWASCPACRRVTTLDAEPADAGERQVPGLP